MSVKEEEQVVKSRPLQVGQSPTLYTPCIRIRYHGCDSVLSIRRPNSTFVLQTSSEMTTWRQPRRSGGW